MENESSKKLSDAKSSSHLFLVFGAIGLLLIAGIWLGIIPLHLATYMKILYTIVLGALFLVFLAVGIHYTRRLKTLQQEADQETQKTREIIQWMTEHYSLEALDDMRSPEEELAPEQLYFERSEQIARLLLDQFGITDEKYLDYLIENIYQIYVPSEDTAE